MTRDSDGRHAMLPGAGDERTPRGRGFAAMDPVRRREIASLGGRAAHRSGHAHEFDSHEAAVAGRKGGLASGGHRRRAAALDGRGS